MTKPTEVTWQPEDTSAKFALKLWITYIVLLMVPALLFAGTTILDNLRTLILFLIPIFWWIELSRKNGNYFFEYSATMNACWRYSVMLLLVFVVLLTVFFIKKYKDQRKHLFFAVVSGIVFFISLLNLYSEKHGYSLSTREPLMANSQYTSDTSKVFYNDTPILTLKQNEKIRFHEIIWTENYTNWVGMYFINDEIYRAGSKVEIIKNPSEFTQLYAEIYTDSMQLYLLTPWRPTKVIDWVEPGDFIAYDQEGHFLLTKKGLYEMERDQGNAPIFKKKEWDVVIDNNGKVFFRPPAPFSPIK